uniref:SH3 domain containing ring finger 3 n=1 Tax=Poecilia latipinna TaxID=48699 RepID=A0A3B3UPR4_9TELE
TEALKSKEPGDLQFSKGDIIILRRKVDDNWYHGELNGCHGFLPASYIQLLRPLNKDQDKDCLAFSKNISTASLKAPNLYDIHADDECM